MTDLKHEFWERIKKVNASMLGLVNDGPFVAMSPQLDDDQPGHIWFITAKGTDLSKAVANTDQQARMIISDDSAGLYADVTGVLRHTADQEALDDVWSFVADAWFEGGKHDPDVVLLCFTPASATLSITHGGGARFFYEIAKGNLTGEKPDIGEHGQIAF